MGGLARPSLMCFLNLALTLAGGLSAVPSARGGGWGEDVFPVWLSSEPIPPCSEPRHAFLLLRPSPELTLPCGLPGAPWLLRSHPAPPGHPSASFTARHRAGLWCMTAEEKWDGRRSRKRQCRAGRLGGSSEGGGACLPPEEDMLTGLGGIAPEDLSVEMGSLVSTGCFTA